MFVERRIANLTVGLTAALASLVACGASETVEVASEAVDCVAIDDGAYFVVREGRLSRVSAPEATVVERVVEVSAPTNWSGRLESRFAAAGYPWMKLNVRGGIATLIGEAPTDAAKEAAFSAGRQAVLDDAEADAQVRVVVDGINVLGGEEAIGAALSRLPERPDLGACQTAFTQTMRGRNVEFRTGGSSISPSSARLLDALTGVARLCADFRVEIGGHTDPLGDAIDNLELSQRRADAVMAYLVEAGVDADQLVAIGYGEERLIDTSGSPEGNARNRRTEFTVTER